MDATIHSRPIRTIPALLIDVLRTIVPTDALSLGALRAFGENFDPDAFLELRRISADEFDVVSPGCRYQYRYPNGGGIELVRYVDIGSIVRIDLNRRLVRKDSDFYERVFGCVSRDAAWLLRLGPSICPRVFEHRGQLLSMSYEGEPVSIYNLPLDWREQAQIILDALRAANCSHNDIKKGNLVVANGKLKIIDFGFATEIGAPIPSHWPEPLGEDHRLGIHRFDDRKAIFEAMYQLEREAAPLHQH